MYGGREKIVIEKEGASIESLRSTALIYNSHPQRRRTVRTEEAIATVERSIKEDPNESIRHRAQELDLCPSTLWKILRKILVCVLTKSNSDEAHFCLNGYVNKQNCRIWSEANQQVYVETPLHPEKLTVWCALWVGGIIGPYFFKNDLGHNVTVNGDRYRAMITNFFIPELNNHDVQKLWFQQDSAIYHTARATIDLLKDMFGDRLISRFGPVNWPPRSCDLTLLDYFLWGYVKSLVYADKPQTLDHLEDNIRRVIVDIRQQMLEKVIENWTSRLDYIRARRGSPMPEIIFKMQCLKIIF
ncbi:putative transposable element [Trichonephila clavipes]|nr:putative transposable element [Trichonephila clavipes]